MSQYCITKIKRGIVKLTRKANLAGKIPGYELTYSFTDTCKIMNLLVKGVSFTSYIYEWSFNPKTSTITVRNTNGNRGNQKVAIDNIQELIDVMFEYFTKTPCGKIVTFDK